MARIHELIGELRRSNPTLGDEIAREVEILSQRRAFGLNFERHTPEAVELPGRRVRIGDKVRVLPPRGSTAGSGDERLWRVAGVDGTGESRLVRLEASMPGGEVEQSSADVQDVVVVAEFRDPIHPGLVSTGKVERGGDKPFHSVINAENYHALQALLYTHRGAVDCIYIDPPYNTGARDWKYNNDYVENDDMYRHSKWLAFMERRLLLAKELLNPDESVLIVTIDEKEYLRLGLLLEQTFPEGRIQMLSTLINPAGSARDSAFRRTDEYMFAVMFGTSAPIPVSLSNGDPDSNAGARIGWENLLRRGTAARRSDRPSMFYPVHVHMIDEVPRFHSVGDSFDGDRNAYVPPAGTTAIWPVRSDGTEGRWKISRDLLSSHLENGFARIGRWRGDETSLSYVPRGELAKISSGEYRVISRREDGSIEVDASSHSRKSVPGTQWSFASHNASEHGTNMLRAVLPSRKFPFPKSLYAVEDAIRFFVANKQEAVILDFFSGSGTTAHAVMRLNKQDGGRRRSISVTNNEVSAEEQRALRQRGLRPGDPEWEQYGICDYITKPRIEAAITGRTPSGEPIKGDYKFTDEFPMADGFEENVEFFTLTYETPMRVQAHREFARIAPLLWLRAGSRGRRIESLPDGWDVAEAYGVIDDIDKTDAFLEAMEANTEARLAFIVTDEDRFFEAIAHALPEHVEAVRLYDSYLRNFEIDAMRGAR